MDNGKVKTCNEEFVDANVSQQLQLNPFENDLILKTLFPFCSVRSLKQCRLVSKLWHKTCNKSLQESSQVRFSNNNEKERQKMHNYLHFVKNENNSYVPFSNYSISYTSESFWKICGSTISKLVLSFCQLQNVEEYRFILFSACPNMKSLSLKCIKVNIVGNKKRPTNSVATANHNMKVLKINHQYEYLGVPWSELLGHFPFLQTLRLSGTIYRFNELCEVVNVIQRQNPNHLQLKHFEYVANEFLEEQEFPAPLYFLLVKTNIHLESLDVGTFTNNMECILKDILIAHGATLKKLKLTGGHYDRLNPIKCFPSSDSGKLEKLEELFLGSPVFSSYAFLQFMPNLKRLDNKFGECNSWGRDVFSEEINVKMEKCRALNIGYQTTITNLNNFIKWFPNVEELGLEVDNEGFRLVCEHWRNLTSLHVYYFSLDDSGLTGLDPEDVKRINKEGQNGSYYPNFVPFANITDLKHLRTFCATKQGQYMIRPKDFGYCAVVHGIQKLPNLRELWIDYYENTDFWKNVHRQYSWKVCQ